MKISLLIIYIGVFMDPLPAYCQTDSVQIKHCIYDNASRLNIASPDAILITPLFDKHGIGMYAFRKRGPHHLNQLAFMENGECEIVESDSSSAFVLKVVNDFANGNKIKLRERKRINKQVQKYIISFKESRYIGSNRKRPAQ